MSAPRKSVIVAWILFVTACEDPLILLHERHLVTSEGADLLLGIGCDRLPDEGDSVSDPEGPSSRSRFRIRTQLFEDGAQVAVFGPTQVRAVNRVYNEDFLDSGRRDEFSIALDAGETLRLVFWGDVRCEFPNVPDNN